MPNFRSLSRRSLKLTESMAQTSPSMRDIFPSRKKEASASIVCRCLLVTFTTDQQQLFFVDCFKVRAAYLCCCDMLQFERLQSTWNNVHKEIVSMSPNSFAFFKNWSDLEISSFHIGFLDVFYFFVSHMPSCNVLVCNKSCSAVRQTRVLKFTVGNVPGQTFSDSPFSEIVQCARHLS